MLESIIQLIITVVSYSSCPILRVTAGFAAIKKLERSEPVAAVKNKRAIYWWCNADAQQEEGEI